MKLTVQMDKMGCLHLWDGEGVPVQVDKYLWEMDGREADYYMQADYHIADFLQSIDATDAEDVENGWHVTVDIDDTMADYISNTFGE